MLRASRILTTSHVARRGVADAGFLELPRLGILAVGDPVVAVSVAGAVIA